jgi:hypothetical protein
MKAKTLDPFSFAQLDSDVSESMPRGEKQWQMWAGIQSDYLNLHETASNVRIPYRSYVQTDAENEWVSDTPATRGEKQWERYNNSNSPHLDWSAKTNQYDVRAPYIGGAGLAQQQWSGDSPADRGEKQWAVYNNSEAYKNVNWDTNVSSRRPYNGAAGLVQAEGEDKPSHTVRGEKQWQQWAQDHVDAQDYQTAKANTRLPYKSTLAQAGWETDPPAVRGEKQWERYTDNNAKHLDWTAKSNADEVRTPYIGSQFVQTDADDKTPAYKVRGEKQWLGWAQSTTDALDHQTEKSNARIPYRSNVQLESTVDAPRGEKQW